MDVNIRELREGEFRLLADFFYDAIFIPPGLEKPNREIIQQPELAIYFSEFGCATDLCLVADFRGDLIGAIWTRVFSEAQPGFGFVDSITPELSMSVKLNYQQKGIGTNLLKAMLDKLTSLGYKQVSLSVDKLNYAYKLYQKFGFEVVKSSETSSTMVKILNF